MSEITTLRLAMLANGYKPVPIRTGRKYPTIDAWPQLAADATPATVDTWPTSHANHESTGVLCGAVLGVDIDVPDLRLSGALEMLAMDHFGMTPLRRVGQAPKALLVYRAASEGVRKLSTPALHLPGNVKVQVEILAHGEQFVAFGMHPDTGRPYSWQEHTPATVALAELPALDEAVVRAFLVDAEAMLRAAGATGLARGVSAAPTTRGPRPVSALSAPSADAVVELLERMPNPIEVDRGEYIRIAMAVRGCVQGLEYEDRLEDGDSDRIGEAFAEWAEKWEGGSQGGELEKWRRDFATRTGALSGWPHLQDAASRLIPEYRDETAGLEFFTPGALASSVVVPGADEAVDWMSMLMRGKPGKDGEEGPIKGNLVNAIVALTYAPFWKGRLRYSTFSHQVFLDAKPFVDTDISRCTVWLQREGIAVVSATSYEAVLAVAAKNTFHPVQDYLNALRWDGVARIDGWLVDYLGAEDTPLHRAVAARFLIGMVARAMTPGAKVDTMLILEGRQGLRKSSALHTLSCGWFTDHMPDLTSKDAPMQIVGVWLCEMAELDKLGKVEISRAKSFLSTAVDRFRKPYGKVAEDVPRQCVFAGTVNPGATGYLTDETGNRRSWPVACGVGWPERQRIDTEALRAVRDQLWAEAVNKHAAGAVWWLNSDDLETSQEAAAETRLTTDAWSDKVHEFIAELNEVSMDDILTECLRMPFDRWDLRSSHRVGRIMRAAGWTTRQVRVGPAKENRRARHFFRPGQQVVVTSTPEFPVLVTG